MIQLRGGYLIYPDLVVHIGLSLGKRLEFLTHFRQHPFPLCLQSILLFLEATIPVHVRTKGINGISTRLG
jgi:hypothetical protein